jgi:hypothetical protein
MICWDDLWEVFTGNFQGTYVCPGNPWDLMAQHATLWLTSLATSS